MLERKRESQKVKIVKRWADWVIDQIEWVT